MRDRIVRHTSNFYEQQRIVLELGCSQILGESFCDGRQQSLDSKYLC